MMNAFDQVLHWLRAERFTYQTKKFDYAEEANRPPEYWDQQFQSYIQRILLFPPGSLQYKQAVLKLAATAVACAEHACEDDVYPQPGLPSGELAEWVDQ